MDALTITTRLKSAFGDDVYLPGLEERQWVVAAEAAGRTVVVEAGDDTIRLYAGRIVDALSVEDDHDLDQVVTLIDAIRSGHAYEYFGYSADPTFGFIGYEINAPGFSVVRIDEGARIVHKAAV